MRPKALRYAVNTLSILVLLLALTYPLAYAGLWDSRVRLKEGSPFNEIGVHFFQDFISRRYLPFLVHVLGGMLALALGPFQFMEGLRSARPKLHRSLGYAYFLGILAGGLGGLVSATRAWGGPLTQWGFGCLAVAWLASSAWGLRLAMGGRLREHQAWMRLSYGITLAAVTLRVQLPILHLAGLSDTHAYQVVAWSCWLPQVGWWLLRGKAGLAPQAA
jgi:hypothetical protein